MKIGTTIIKILQYKSLHGRKKGKTSIVQTAGGDPLRFQLWNQPLCSSLVVQLHLRPSAVLKRRGEGVAGGCSGRGIRVRVLLDVLAALHLWFVLSRLHLDGHHIVAR